MTTPLQRLIERLHHDQAFRMALALLDRNLYGDDPMPPLTDESVFATLVKLERNSY